MLWRALIRSLKLRRDAGSTQNSSRYLLEELLVTRRDLRGELGIERQETGGCIERRDGGVTYG